MKLRPLGLLSLSLALALPPLPARAQQPLPLDAPSVNIQLLLDALKAIKEKRNEAEKAIEASLSANFRAAAASNSSALAFYLQAVEAVDFAGKPSGDFRDWKEKNSDDLKTEAVQNAIRLHLRYLLLTLERARGAATAQLEAPLLAYIEELKLAGKHDEEVLQRRDKAKEQKKMGIATPVIQGKRTPAQEPLFWAQPMIKTGANQSIFVKWYGVQKLFAKAKEWEDNPGNIDGMYKNTLLPWYRETKNFKVITYWDNKLITEGQIAQKSGLTFKIDDYNQIRRPQLLWERYKEMADLGIKNRAIGDMMQLIKDYPKHPDQSNWVATLEKLLLELLNPNLLPAGAAPAPGTPAAPGAPAGASPAAPPRTAPAPGAR